MEKKTILITIVIIGLLAGTVVFLGSPVLNEGDEWGFTWLFGEREEETIIPDVDTETYNEQKAWDDVTIKIAVKNDYTYNHPALAGMAVEVRDAANTYVDGGSTGATGTWTSTVETFSSGETYTLVIGSIATTNKSQTYQFIVQGQDGDTKPTYIWCGTFMYKPVAEESAITFAWYDENYASLSAINFTSTYTDKVVDGFIKVTFSTSSQGFGRDLFSNTRGTAKAYLALIVADSTLLTSSAVRASDTPGYMGMGTPTGKAVFVVALEEIDYVVDEDSVVVPGSEAVHWYRFRLDFTGCGVTGTNATEFTMSGVVSYEWDWTNLAAGGSAWLSTWFSDTDLSSINIQV